jgi:hypothetical protein
MSLVVKGRVADFESMSEGTLELVGTLKTTLHQKARQFIESLAGDPALISFTPQKMEPFLAAAIGANPWVELLYVTDGHGRQVTGNVSLSGIDRSIQGKDWSKRPWFTEPASTGAIYLSGLYRSVATNDFCFTASVPMRRGGAVIGVVAADVNFRSLSSQLSA